MTNTKAQEKRCGMCNKNTVYAFWMSTTKGDMWCCQKCKTKLDTVDTRKRKKK